MQKSLTKTEKKNNTPIVMRGKIDINERTKELRDRYKELYVDEGLRPEIIIEKLKHEFGISESLIRKSLKVNEFRKELRS